MPETGDCVLLGGMCLAEYICDKCFHVFSAIFKQGITNQLTRPGLKRGFLRYRGFFSPTFINPYF